MLLLYIFAIHFEEISSYISSTWLYIIRMLLEYFYICRYDWHDIQIWSRGYHCTFTIVFPSHFLTYYLIYHAIQHMYVQSNSENGRGKSWDYRDCQNNFVSIKHVCFNPLVCNNCSPYYFYWPVPFICTICKKNGNICSQGTDNYL